MSVRTFLPRLRRLAWPPRSRAGLGFRLTLAAAAGLLSIQAWFMWREARLHGNEAAAIGTLRALNTAQSLFREGDLDGDGEFRYAFTLRDLVAAELLDPGLADAEQAGYRFELHTSPTTSEFLWCAVANPTERGRTGERSFFFANHTGVIHYKPGSDDTAVATDCMGDPSYVAG